MPQHVAFGSYSTDRLALDSQNPDPRRGWLISALVAGLVTSLAAYARGDDSTDVDPSLMMGRLAEARGAGDACLRAVQFVDQHEGWAVGDQGVIWHTMDGGTTWERQSSGVRATLTTISMIEKNRGWIGAREPIPYNPGSSGLLLGTRNGGAKWDPSPPQFLPGINKVCLVDRKNAWLLGETSDQHPTGVFFTDNGGMTWIGARGPRSYGWLSGFFVGMDFGIVGGAGGPFKSSNEAVAVAAVGEPGFCNFGRGTLSPAKADWLANTTVRDFAVYADAIWAVGDQAQVFMSADQGRTWKRPNLKLPGDIAKAWDFHAVAAMGSKIWICGRPGSIVLHSPDNGATWQIQKTNQSLPINDIQFVDASNGWAVGAMGTILKSADGGANWQVQRRGGSRAAVLWVNQDSRNLPLSVLARHGGDEGYLNVAMALTAPDLTEDSPNASNRASRFSDAFRAAGGAFSEYRTKFPLAGDRVDEEIPVLLERWNQLYEGQATREIEREIVLAIRMYRPDVIVTDALQPNATNNMASALTAMGVKRAFATAADPSAFPEQIQQLGLSPHKASRLFAAAADTASAGVVLSSNDIGPRMGASFADVAEAAFPLVFEAYRPVEVKAAFTLVESQNEKAGDGRSLLSGLAIAPGSDARRSMPADNMNAGITEAVTKRVEKKRTMMAVLDRSEGVAAERNLAQLKQMTGDLDKQQAGQVVFELGRKYAASGRWEFAQPAFDYLVRNYPDHPLALEGYRWLIAYQCSSEARRRAPKPAKLDETATRFVKPDDKTPTKTIQTAEHLQVDDPNAIERWNRNAIAYGELLRKRSPHLYSDPRIQLCLAAAQRQVGSLDQVKGILSNVLTVDPNSRWAPVTRLENFLMGAETGTPPLGIAWTNFTTKRPKLDGILDDECWKGGKRLPLIFGDDAIDKPFATDVMFRNDSEYLYIAAECHYPSADYNKPKAERVGHDPDLSAFDRIEILIDPDRDYTTYYRLRVDQRGLVADDCWGDASWNPKWFVATSSDEKGWRVEAAIPLNELADYINPKESWAFNVQRVIPGKAVLAWNQPAGIDPRPEGFGHLRFVKRVERAGDVLGGN